MTCPFCRQTIILSKVITVYGIDNIVQITGQTVRALTHQRNRQRNRQQDINFRQQITALQQDRENFQREQVLLREQYDNFQREQVLHREQCTSLHQQRHNFEQEQEVYRQNQLVLQQEKEVFQRDQQLFQQERDVFQQEKDIFVEEVIIQRKLNDRIKLERKVIQGVKDALYHERDLLREREKDFEQMKVIQRESFARDNHDKHCADCIDSIKQESYNDPQQMKAILLRKIIPMIDDMTIRIKNFIEIYSTNNKIQINNSVLLHQCTKLCSLYTTLCQTNLNLTYINK